MSGFTPGPTDTTVADELALVIGAMQMSGYPDR
jgi:hypothetical protein